MSKDNINPDHYKEKTSLECIEAMQIAFGRDRVITFCMLNAWKYIWRWKHKIGEVDLNKARWYIDSGVKLVNDFETSPQLGKYSPVLAEMAIYVEQALNDMERVDEDGN